ncbi:hypothetical protein XU18_1945 [Perkinsela sp. CCAP 1560/4]|nr:hypothetical protein XU18_1945 [Perkinsela sp. CCAP 1560/4]|eukprot:KNH07413.1 hypothetical protein XU18_1945 [Perkinsela sp. CCAP 1560/4]
MGKRDFQDDEVDVDELPKEMQRASAEELQGRKIRRPNYHKGMKSDATSDQEKKTERNPFASVFLKQTKDSEDAKSTEAASKPVTEETKPDNLTTEKKLEVATEEASKAEAPQVEAVVTAPKSTNPFAQILKQMTSAKSVFGEKTEVDAPSTDLFKSATPFASGWKVDPSFTSTAMRQSEAKAEAHDQSEDDLAQEEPADEAHELSVPEDEVVVARCHVKAFRFDATNKAWSELGPGILKLSVHKDLHGNIEAVSSESNFGRVLFHDSRNRVNRMNFPLGESFKISPTQGNQSKNLIFTTAVSGEDGKDSECQTYLVKPIAEKEPNADQRTQSGMGEFRTQLESYNNSIIKRSSENKA